MKSNKKGADFYTYTLAYPDGTVFYVGKGTGNRIDHHEKEAHRGHACKKCQTIRLIWATGEQVVKTKVREHLTEDEALDLEAKTIDMLGPWNLTNGDYPFRRYQTTAEERIIINKTRREHAELLGLHWQ